MQVTQTELAEIFGVTSRTIRYWHKAGLPKTKGTKKPYCVSEVIRWRIDNLKKDNPSTSRAKKDEGTDKLTASKRQCLDEYIN